MRLHKVTLMEAYLIETLRSNGIPNDELLKKVAQKDIRSWEDINPKFDFNGLISLYEKDEAAFKSIINDGYKVKFLTFKGLENLLKFRLDKVAEEDYEILENGISELKVKEEELNVIKQLLSTNWTIHETENSDNENKNISIFIQSNQINNR